jgi:hypothetical protein
MSKKIICFDCSKQATWRTMGLITDGFFCDKHKKKAERFEKFWNKDFKGWSWEKLK